MPKLAKRELLDKIVSAIKACGWHPLYLGSTRTHPFRLRIFQEHEAYTVRIYIWNMTHGGGMARPLDEYRIQITPVSRFEPEPDGKTLILGWWDEAGVFAGFDYRKHSGPLGASPSMQIREAFLRAAYRNGFSLCNKGNQEIAVAFRPDFFVEYVRSLQALHDVGKSNADFQALTAVSIDPASVSEHDLEQVTTVRRKAIASVLRTLRDNSFKDRVLTCYGYRCAICGLQLGLVEAAHIIAVADPHSTDETCNGLALCTLHHRAYDKALVTVDDAYRVKISVVERNRLRQTGHDGGIDLFVSGLRPLILLPPDAKDRPKAAYLRQAQQIRDWAG